MVNPRVGEKQGSGVQGGETLVIPADLIDYLGGQACLSYKSDVENRNSINKEVKDI